MYEYTWEESDSDDNAEVKKHGMITIGKGIEDLPSTTRICGKSVRNELISLQNGASSGTW